MIHYQKRKKLDCKIWNHLMSLRWWLNCSVVIFLPFCSGNRWRFQIRLRLVWRELLTTKITHTSEIRSKDSIQENAVVLCLASLWHENTNGTYLTYNHSSIFVFSFSQEWHLVCSHYIVLSAFKGSCQDIKEELFCQHSGKYFYLPLYSANVTLSIQLRQHI